MPQSSPCPLNEFSEVATGDMHSMDSARHYELNPHKSDDPVGAAKSARVFELVLRGVPTREANEIIKAQDGR